MGCEHGAGAELRELAREMKLSDHVVFGGEMPHCDLHVYYEAASVFCLPSRVEPFGIVLLEAGAFRCPVVATSTGGVPEILTDRVNARLVPPDDPAALAEATRRAAARPLGMRSVVRDVVRTRPHTLHVA